MPCLQRCLLLHVSLLRNLKMVPHEATKVLSGGCTPSLAGVDVLLIHSSESERGAAEGWVCAPWGLGM